jgi:hypothetical protein
MEKPGLSESASAKWTHPDEYVAAMARKRTARRTREGNSRRTQPEAPSLWLSTLPYVALIAVLAVLTVAIALVAFPGSQPPPRQPRLVVAEPGVAQKGWFEHAEREFHR